jgi:transposase
MFFPVDMRKSFDGLSALTQHRLGEDPLSGALFVFINRRATQMKVLYFDRSGFCVWAKRLEAGRFISDWNKVHTQQMDWTQLKLLLEGIETIRQRKRYRHAMPAQNTASRSTTLNNTSLNQTVCAR